MGEIPNGLNRDEAAIGYNAFSLLQTGRDEYGASYPISFKSFGDWKLPAYIYASILPVSSFGLNQFSVRSVSFIAGSLTVFLTYLIGKKIFYRSQKASLLAAFILAITPWHIHFSRIASEANLAAFSVALGVVIYLYGSYSKIWLAVSSVILSFSLFSYHGNHLFTPLLFLWLLFLLRRNMRKLLIFALPFSLLALYIYSGTLFSADRTKMTGLSYFADEYSVYEKTDLLRLDHTSDAFLARLLHNKITYAALRFVEGYFKSLSPEFLVIKGGDNRQHNIPNFGNLYLWEYPVLFAGFYFFFRRKLPWRLLISFWLFTAILPAAITRDSPHSARMFAVMPVLALLSAAGLQLLTSHKSGRGYYPRQSLVITIIIAFNLLLYTDQYFLHFPVNSDKWWGDGYRQLVDTVELLKPEYREIVMDRPENSPYIYFLFYNATDPEYYRRKAVRFSQDREGFQHVAQLDKLKFKKLDWGNDLTIPDRLLVSYAESTPPNATSGAVRVDKKVLAELRSSSGSDYGLQERDVVVSQLVKTIYLRDGQPYFYLIKVTKQNEN